MNVCIKNKTLRCFLLFFILFKITSFIVFFQCFRFFLLGIFSAKNTVDLLWRKKFFYISFLFFLHTFVLTFSSALAQIDGSSHVQWYESKNKLTEKNNEFHKDFDQIPDGQDLLLRPKVGSLIYEFDIYALKKNETIYFSLIDLIEILELAIDFDEKTQTGKGWFLREDWEIEINLEKGTVFSKGKKFDIRKHDFFSIGGYVYIAQEALSQWLDIELISDIGQQYVEIKSDYPLPGVARAYRRSREEHQGLRSNDAELPRQQTQYDWFDINTADINLGTRYRRFANNSDRSHTAGVAVQGQLLKQEAYALVSADSKNNVTSIRARLSKTDEEAKLLGPLKAKSYVFGDTDVTDIPLTGNSQQEFGFRVSNATQLSSQFEVTDISGDALPDWDVELYRNGVLSANQRVGSNGLYQFTDVPLFAGSNSFEIFFYGPQGEIRRRSLEIPVDTSLLASQDGAYDVSISLNDTQTYKPLQVEDMDSGTLHVTARYNKYIGDTLSYVGIKNRDVEGNNKTFVGVGATRLISDTIVDINTVIDDDANMAGQIIARKKVGNWDVSARGYAQSENFSPNESVNPRIYELSGNAQRAFNVIDGVRSHVSGQLEYGELTSGDNSFSARWGSSHQFNAYNISNTTFYENSESLSYVGGERLENTLSARANLGKVFIRGGVNYDVKPEAQIDEYFSQISYRPYSHISGDVYFEHEPDRNFSEARLNVNYTHDHFKASPFIEVDSDNEIYTGVNVNVNIVDDPKSNAPIITSKRAVGRGMVSSFVYHDKNGDFEFNDDDEVLPDVVIESVNIRRRAKTNEDGYSFIQDLSGVRATDIVVDEDTLPDPFMISANPGGSILPSAGEIYEMQFPIHMAGEVDGVVSIRDVEGSVELVKGGDVLFYPLSDAGEVVKVPIAYDGFYLASKLKPGRYLVSVSGSTAEKNSAAAPIPQIVEIGYGGDVIYGKNIELRRSELHVPLEVVYQDVTQDKDQPAYSLLIESDKESNLGGMISQYIQANVPAFLFDELSVINASNESAKGVEYYGHEEGLDMLYQRCALMQQYGLNCKVRVRPNASILL
ncbi:MAG: hypothetical protein HRT94_05600 [Alphaproteobacteria bacterium]|nr:hypothetical protein [Alphaproteobacteria bacterium]